MSDWRKLLKGPNPKACGRRYRIKCVRCGKTKIFTKFYLVTGNRYPGLRRTTCAKCIRITPASPRTSEQMRNWNLRFNYNITLKEWNIKFIHQKKRCAICKRQKPVGRGWATDHKGKKVRGILCSCCNTALGLTKESVRILKNMIVYIEKNR